MQTRRRLHQQDQATTQEEGYPLITQQQQPQLVQQSYNNFPQNPLFVNNNGVGSTATSPLLNSSIQQQQQSQYQQPSINIRDSGVVNHNKVPIDDTDDDKYSKAGRQWNLRSLSSRIQSTSGQALRNFIQQPLSAAAAVVTGNYQESTPNEGLVLYDNNNFSGKAHPIQQIDDDLEDLFDKENIVVMAARDRTGEFNNAIRSLQSRNISRAVNIRDPRKAKQVQSYSEFMMVAKMIGKNIASTYAKLEKLTLCK